MNKQILVIDDDEAIRKSFKLALDGVGYRVDAAESGKIGIREAQKTAYDLIFLDLKMPGLNGVETLRELRKVHITVPVYIVTAFHKEFFKDLKILTEDGTEFELLRKPIGGDEILDLADSVLGRKL